MTVRRLVIIGLTALALGAVPAASASASGQEVAPTPTITVMPSTNLVDGQVVTVSGTGWQPDVASLSLRLCGEVDVYACPAGAFAATDGSGAFSVSFTVRATDYYFSDGIDCRTESCVLRAGYTSRDDGVTAPVSFDPDGPLLRDPHVSVDPAGPLVDGQLLTVTSSGWDPSQEVRIVECDADRSLCPTRWERVDADATGSLAIEYRVRGQGDIQREGDLDCRTEPCFLHLESAHNRVAVALIFDPGVPPLPSPTLQVTPDHDLVPGQRVHLEGAGFFPGQELVYGECNSATYLRPPDCYWGDITADAGGAISFDTTVAASIYAYHSAFHDCRPDHCYFAVSTWYEWHTLASAQVHLLPEGDEQLTVRPTAGLHDGDTVRIDATGLNRGLEVQVAQCVVANPQYPFGQCVSAPVTLPVDDAGELHTTMRLRDHLTAQYGDPPEQFDCRVVECQVIVGGPGVRYHPDYYGRYYHWHGAPLTFAGVAPPATPTAVAPAFTG